MRASLPAHYDLIVVGSGFASAFFLHEYLKHAASRARVLVLERGARRSHRWQLAHPDAWEREAQESFDNATPDKAWRFTLALGGGSNCWWASTPRMLPADFTLSSRYGVGRDWPISYSDVEPYYGEVEDLMQVAGPSDRSPFERSRPYPQPPHRLSEADELLRQAFPDQFFHQPTARPTRVTPSGRAACCASGVCTLCPIDSKFTILNEMKHVFEDPRVTVMVAATAHAVETRGGSVFGVRYLRNGIEYVTRGELVALGANAIFNAHILLRSGLGPPPVGWGLVEQTSVGARVALDDRFLRLGSTSITGHGYMFYDGPHRRERAAALIETLSMPSFLSRRGRLLQALVVKFIVEDLPNPESTVALAPNDHTKPVLTFKGRSPYARRTVERFSRDVATLVASLPVADVEFAPPSTSEAHILGTTVMGHDPMTSVVDPFLIHHRLRNLVVLGSGVFPTAAPANPTLTLSALSLRSARHLVGT